MYPLIYIRYHRITAIFSTLFFHFTPTYTLPHLSSSDVTGKRLSYRPAKPDRHLPRFAPVTIMDLARLN